MFSNYTINYWLFVVQQWLWFQLKIQVVALSQKSPRENVIKKRYCILTREITNQLKVFLTNWNNEAKILERGTRRSFILNLLSRLFTKCLYFKNVFSPTLKIMIFEEISKEHSSNIHKGFCPVSFSIHNFLCKKTIFLPEPQFSQHNTRNFLRFS